MPGGGCGQDGASNDSSGAGSGGDVKRPLMLKFAWKNGQQKEDEPSDTVYITGLPAFMNDATVAKMFEDVGLDSEFVRCCDDHWGGQGYQACNVKFRSTLEAATAIEAFSGKFI